MAIVVLVAVAYADDVLAVSMCITIPNALIHVVDAHRRGRMSGHQLTWAVTVMSRIALTAISRAGAPFLAALRTAATGLVLAEAVREAQEATKETDKTTDLAVPKGDPICVGPSINIGGEGEIPNAININTPWILDPDFLASRDGTTNIRGLQGQGHRFITFDGSRIPIRSESVCTVFTKSIPPMAKNGMLLEIIRVLKPGGVWIDYNFVGPVEVPYVRYRKGGLL